MRGVAEIRMGKGRKGKESSKRIRQGAKLGTRAWRKDTCSDAGAAVGKGRSKGRKRQATERRSELQKFREVMSKGPSNSDRKVYKQ